MALEAVVGRPGVEEAWHALDETRERRGSLEEELAETSIFRFQDRASLRDQIDIHRDIEARQLDRWEDAAEAYLDVEMQTDSWMDRHGEEE